MEERAQYVNGNDFKIINYNNMIKEVIMMKKVEVTRADVDRLNKNAGHQAVIVNGETFIQVGTTDGLIYYFGNAVNYYLLEGPYNLCDNEIYKYN